MRTGDAKDRGRAGAPSPRPGGEPTAGDQRLSVESVLDALPGVVYLTDAEGRVTFTNRSAARLLHEAGAGSVPGSHGDGLALPETEPSPMFDGQGDFIGQVHGLFDPMLFRAAEDSLRELALRYHYTVTLGDQLPWVADEDGSVYDVGERWLEVTGMSPDAVLGHRTIRAVHPEDRQRTADAWDRSVATGALLDNEYRLRMADGTYRWFRSRAAPHCDAHGRILRWYGTSEDIHERRMAEADLRWQASHDELTGVGNRIAFQAGLQRALAPAAAGTGHVGVLVFDIDHFKLINDRHGHDTGDALLAEIGARLRAIVFDGETAARLGGDEFAVIMPARAAIDDVERRAAAIVAQLGGCFGHAGQTYDHAVSAGIAVYPAHGVDADQILKNADLALYEAKANGRGQLCMFHGEMRAEQQRRASMLAMARRASEDRAIAPHYQPKVWLGSGAVAGFEALMRWHHPRLGLQLPHIVVAAFEDPEVARLISEDMLDAVVTDIVAWLEAGIDFGHVAVNVSPADLRRPDYGEALLDRLRIAGIAPQFVELEVTETVFLSRGAEGVEPILRGLSKAGVRIALDDFGTGYASLSHLQHFPVDAIKIERSFVEPLKAAGAEAPIVNAIIGLARGFRMFSVAEGIETLAQANALRRAGCDIGQGFHFGPAIPAAEVPTMLARRAGVRG